MENVTLVGLDEHGHPVLDCILSVPDPISEDSRPTAPMLDAVEIFYGSRLPELTGHQAHCLLALRDYATFCVDALKPGRSRKLSRLLARATAMEISASDVTVQDIARWADRQFKAGAETSNIRRTKHFRIAADFLEELECEVSSVGGCI